jgi:hypothetical protein
MAYFKVGENSRNVLMDKSTYNEVCTLLNDARKVGAQDAVKDLLSVVNEWAA